MSCHPRNLYPDNAQVHLLFLFYLQVNDAWLRVSSRKVLNVGVHGLSFRIEALGVKSVESRGHLDLISSDCKMLLLICCLFAVPMCLQLTRGDVAMKQTQKGQSDDSKMSGSWGSSIPKYS